MKITRVTPLMVDRYLLVTVETDAGITGLGESGAWGFLEASGAAIEKFGRYLVGQDPLKIEHHWQYMYRFSHFRGAAIMGALSALDIALWDIAGKHFKTPVYQLLGGKVREKARVYYHVFGETRDELVNGVKDAKKRGFTAVGHLTPFLDEDRAVPYFKTHAQKMAEAIDAVRLYREAVGNEVDLCIEIHRRLTPAEAVQLGLGIEKYTPFFFEDPVTPDNFDEMAYVADKINIPIATGERYTSLWEFEMALSRNAVQYVRPDVCLVGGISGAKKIAALAEARHVGVVPHNPLSPVSTAACLQIAACIPNFALQEYPIGEDRPPKSDMVTGIAEHDGKGYLVISDRPGIGMDLKPGALTKAPMKPREVTTRLHADGSVIDQ
ncbi:MAG: mandelate racemase/muconate lactonizing enzyme family protein [Dehalococcoidia bacterium]|nr:mandelate racemase/muconate lactonizing enzyme family protein [Dehalococcoidia bacterium]MSQ34942.1 mandelate racemase/muconate lactonizing enzyme family protein [Dehalococcoidia bacterium]